MSVSIGGEHVDRVESIGGADMLRVEVGCA